MNPFQLDVNPFQLNITATVTLLTQHDKKAGTGDHNTRMNAVYELHVHICQQILKRNPTIAQILSDEFYRFLTLDDMRVTGITDEALLKQILAIWRKDAHDETAVTNAPKALGEFALFELMTKLGPESFTCMLDALEIPEIERHKEKPIADQAILVLRYLKPLSGGLDRLRTSLTVSFPDLLERS